MAKLRCERFQISPLLILVALFAPSNCFWKKTDNVELRQNETALQCLLPPQCSLPCVGKPPPRICPAVIPNCKHGCACYTYCENGLPVLHECFETEDCTKKTSRTPPITLPKYDYDELHRRHTSVEYDPRTRSPAKYGGKSIHRKYEWGQLNLRHARISSIRPRQQTLHDEVRATWTNRKVSRPIIEFQTPKINLGNVSWSRYCENLPMLSGEFKLKSRVDYGRRGWIQKKTYVKKNHSKYEETAMPVFTQTQVASTRRSLPQRFLNNVFVDEMKVLHDKNSFETKVSPSKQMQSQKNELSATAKNNNFSKTTLFSNDFEVTPTKYDRKVRRNEPYNNSESITQKKSVKNNRLLFTTTNFVRGARPYNFNYGHKRQSFNSQAGRRYLGGLLPQFDISQVGVDSKQITNLNLVGSSQAYQTYRPEPTASPSQEHWFTWRNIMTRLPSGVPQPTENIDIDSNILLNHNFVQRMKNNEPSQSTIQPSRSNEIRLKNNAYTVNIIMPVQYYDPGTSKPKQEDDMTIILQGHAVPIQNGNIKIKASNDVFDTRVQSQNNGPIQSSGLISLPDSNLNYRPKIHEYGPITPARKRYKTGPSNDDFKTQRYDETSRKPPQSKEFSESTPHLAEVFHGDSASESAALFLSK